MFTPVSDPIDRSTAKFQGDSELKKSVSDQGVNVLNESSKEELRKPSELEEQKAQDELERLRLESKSGNIVNDQSAVQEEAESDSDSNFEDDNEDIQTEAELASESPS